MTAMSNEKRLREQANSNWVALAEEFMKFRLGESPDQELFQTNT